MNIPILSALPTAREIVDRFGGYDHRTVIAAADFYNMKNLTSAHYPLLSVRSKRGILPTGGKVSGLTAKDALIRAEAPNLVINGYPVNLGLSEGEKTMVSMGAYVIIMPDRKWLNTADFSQHGNIEASFTAEGARIEPATLTGESIPIAYRQASEPPEPENLVYWLDTGSSPHVLKQWSETQNSWVTIETVYLKITAPGIGNSFALYDGIRISGMEDSENEQLKALCGSAVIWGKDDNWITIIGMLDESQTLTVPLTVARRMPEMDFIIESQNRLWGCRYGPDADGNIVNEIYASKLGDFKNWECYMGTATDSYRVSVGSDGQFTGAITHLGFPLFWKENHLHKVYGNYPANFQVVSARCRGVQRGSGKSLAIVGETLIYKSSYGVCAYDGSLPSDIGQVFGEELYHSAVAGAHGGKYYISMLDAEENPHLFVFDAERNLWHREDETRAQEFCSDGNEMYMRVGGEVMTLISAEGSREGAIAWMAETGVLGLTITDPGYASAMVGRKYVQRLTLRLAPAKGSIVKVSIQYDSRGGWQHAGSITGDRLGSRAIVIRPKRCDHFRLRLEGRGDCRVYSIEKVIAGGSAYR